MSVAKYLADEPEINTKEPEYADDLQSQAHDENVNSLIDLMSGLAQHLCPGFHLTCEYSLTYLDFAKALACKSTPDREKGQSKDVECEEEIAKPDRLGDDAQVTPIDCQDVWQDEIDGRADEGWAHHRSKEKQNEVGFVGEIVSKHQPSNIAHDFHQQARDQCHRVECRLASCSDP